MLFGVHDLAAGEAQEGFERRRRMGRAAGDEERRHGWQRAVRVESAGDGARAGGDQELRLRRGGIRLLKRKLHVRRDRTRQVDRVRMARRGDEADAEASHVPRERAEDVRVEFARGATAGRDFAQLERLPERTGLRIRLSQRLVGRFSGADDQCLAREDAEAVFLREADLVGAGLGAAAAERAAAHVEERAARVAAERVRDGADGLRPRKVVRCEARVERGASAKVRRQVRACLERERARPKSLPKS